MYIREYMKSPVITVKPDTLLDEALRTMTENNIRRLPVTDDRKLVGLLTRQTLRQATLSTSIAPLSSFGMRHQLLRMKVKDAMITDIVTVTPDTTLEEAALLAEKRQIGTLPVIDKQGNLIGLVTTTDFNNLTGQLLGFGKEGSHIYVSGLSDYDDARRPQIMEILVNQEIPVRAIFNVLPPATKQQQLIIHLTANITDETTAELKRLGLDIEVRK